MKASGGAIRRLHPSPSCPFYASKPGKVSRPKFDGSGRLSSASAPLSRGVVRVVAVRGFAPLPFAFVLSSFSSFFEMVIRAATQRRQAVDRTTPALMQTCRQRAPSALSQTIRASSGFSIRSQSKHSSIRLIAAALGIICAEAPRPAQIELQLANGRCLRFPPTLEMATLMQVIRAVEAA